ncbi:MAG: ABC transporter permease [Gemmatimonadetes bacterium]|nr:ABC transporter permease [Gemmatimonadota bacterium]
MVGITRDLTMGLRSLRRRPALVLVAGATIGIGVGSATAIYSVVHGVLLAPLPYDAPDRIMRVGKISEGRAGILSVSALDLGDLQERNRSFSALAASRPRGLTVYGDPDPEYIRAATVSSGFFDVLGRYPALGSHWSPDADREGGAPQVVLAHSLWQRRWGGSADIVGGAVVLDGTPFVVAGVMPPDFVPPEGLGQSGTEAWIPLSSLDPDARSQRRNGFLQVIGRLGDDATPESAGTELVALGAALSREYPEAGERTFGLAPLRSETVGDAGAILLPLLFAVGLLLTITCVNVAHLLLMRANERSHEMALRGWLGARRLHIVRQLLAEGLLLGLVGGLVGAALAAVAVDAFVALGPNDIPRISELAVDRHLFGITLALAFATSILFTLPPALRAARMAERGEAGGALARHSATKGKVRVRDALIVAECALAIVLVVAGGLLSTSLYRLAQVDPGFSSEGIGAMSVVLPATATPVELVDDFGRMIERIRTLPGIEAAGATANLPLSGNAQMLRLRSPGLLLGAEDEAQGGAPVDYQQVTSGYFAALDIPLRAGRLFSSYDDATSPPVAIVNQALATRIAGDGDVVGRRITLSDDPDGSRPIEIVGVVGDVRQKQLDQAAAPELFLPFPQRPTRRLDLVARTTGDDTALLSAMQGAIREVRPDLPVRRSVDMTRFMRDSIAERRFVALVLGAFGLCALGLTMAGVYGTLAFVVAARRQELGVRLALGASHHAIIRTVLERALRPALLGVGIGVLAALPVTRLLDALLFGVTRTDPTTFVGAVALVLGAACLASLEPARRALRVDPLSALRLE